MEVDGLKLSEEKRYQAATAMAAAASTTTYISFSGIMKPRRIHVYFM